MRTKDITTRCDKCQSTRIFRYDKNESAYYDGDGHKLTFTKDNKPKQ